MEKRMNYRRKYICHLFNLLIFFDSLLGQANKSYKQKEKRKEIKRANSNVIIVPVRHTVVMSSMTAHHLPLDLPTSNRCMSP